MSVIPGEWNEVVKGVVAFGLSKIPVIGEILEKLIEWFWPPTKEDIWEQIKDQVTQVVKQAILDFETIERKADLNTLRDYTKSYYGMKGEEKANMLTDTINKCVDVKNHLMISDNRLHLLPYLVTLAAIHLSLLRERYQHGAEIFSSSSLNPDLWLKELSDTYNEYRGFYQDCISKWIEWRYQQVTIYNDSSNGVNGQHYEVGYKDNLTGEEKRFGGFNDSWDYKYPVEQLEALVKNKLTVELLKTLGPTFWYNNYLPGASGTPSPLKGLEVFHLQTFYPLAHPFSNLSGEMQQSDIGSFEFGKFSGYGNELVGIGSIETNYTNGITTTTGNDMSKASNRYHVSRPGKPITGVAIVRLTDRVLDQLIFTYDGGLTAGFEFQNHQSADKPGCLWTNLNLGFAYKLEGIQTQLYSVNYAGRQKQLCIGAISFKFVVNYRHFNQL